MSPRNFAQLILLAAIWGGSFLCMRVAVPHLGPVWLMESRVALAALLLGLLALRAGGTFWPRRHWRAFIVLGILNTALPFLLYAWAARELSASLLSILNATAPIWGALWAAVWLRQIPSARAASGLAVGLFGVALVVGFDPAAQHAHGALALTAGVLAPCCYGLALTWLRRSNDPPPPETSAHGSMLAASLVLLPLLPFSPLPAALPGTVALAVLALGLLCTAYAYQIYFRLIAEAGPTQALAVTFLVPIFGVLWGTLLLGESLSGRSLLGAAVVLAGTMLTTGFSPRALLRR